MYRRVAYRTLLVPDLGLVMQARRLRRKLLGDPCMAFKAELSDGRPFQHLRVGRAVRNMANGTALELERCMFEYERSLFVRVTFDASRISTDRELGLLSLKTAVSVMAI